MATNGDKERATMEGEHMNRHISRERRDAIGLAKR